MYYLNASDGPTFISFCQGPRKDTSCLKVKPKFQVHANGSVVVNVRRLNKAYIIVETATAVPSAVLYLHPGSGAIRSFESDSSITFGMVK